jgi:hypothetical protein
LDFLWQAGREAEADEVRDALQWIAGPYKKVSAKIPNIGCREALARWDEVTELAQRLVRARRESAP